jgi:hypothetical protein
VAGDFDDAFIAPVYGFRDKFDYYTQVSLSIYPYATVYVCVHTYTLTYTHIHTHID